VTDLVFFYGTLMAAFRRPRGLSVDSRLTSCGRGSISAMLFDLGTYPGAVPATGSRVMGEVHRMASPDDLLRAFDEIEDFNPSKPGDSLYVRVEVPVTFEDGHVDCAWVYFYNAPLKRAERIESGDYLEYLTRQNCRIAGLQDCRK
jgi:gamma-glutamylcyclotransferase (GGCT)/AIG2-like uncharacterized protein YtfP